MYHIYLSLLFKIFLYKYEYGNLCKRHDYNANSEYVHFQLYIILLFKYFTKHYSIIWLNNLKLIRKSSPSYTLIVAFLVFEKKISHWKWRQILCLEMKIISTSKYVFGQNWQICRMLVYCKTLYKFWFAILFQTIWKQ